jgi:5-methylcytosine-specific restriction endonuclease McrA
MSINDQAVIEAAETTNSATEAAAKLGVHYTTYRTHAKRLGVFKTNSSGKGTHKRRAPQVATETILSNQHPQFQTYKLKHRLIKEGLLENVCSRCGLKDWQGESIQMHLDHHDGNKYNHSIDNLRMLCPNCHSQTSTYCGRNKRGTKSC